MAREAVSNNPSVNITQIKKGSVIHGDMESKHSIRVDGFVTGDLISSEKVIIGTHGEIGGNLSAADVTVEGFVMGDVMVTGILHIAQEAEINGQIYAREISVEKGAEIKGQIAVGKQVLIPSLDAVPEEKESSETEEHRKVSGKNYGTVAW